MKGKVDWVSVLRAWLHDPPSKALDVRGHEAAGDALLRIALGDEGVGASAAMKTSDVLAAAAERLPMPSPGPDYARAVGVAEVRAIHPLSGADSPLDVDRLSREDERREVATLVEAVGDSTRERFLALWRFLPERLAARSPTWLRLPADTRQPDHTIWQHMDMAAAFEAAGGAGASLLSFSIGPVQSFIASSRTLRDLWSGSLLLSWLAFSAARPILADRGPQAFVFPSMRRIPFVDDWLVAEAGLPQELFDKARLRELLKVPALPNRFLALVPGGDDGEALREKVEQGALAAWREVADAVRREIDHRLGAGFAGWDARWNEQVEHWFDVRVGLLPRDELQREPELRWQLLSERFEKRALAVRKLEAAIPESDRQRFTAEQNVHGLWEADVAIAGKLLEAAKLAPRGRPSASGAVPPKCTMMGDLEQVGPAGLDDSARFWGEALERLSFAGFRLREGERLSAIGLVKRFWVPIFLEARWARWGFRASETRILDTASVAARPWLDAHGIDPLEPATWGGQPGQTWNGEWLSDEPGADAGQRPARIEEALAQRRPGAPKRPQRYLAVLAMDGDRLGQWLRGDIGPSLEEVYHPKLREYFGKLPGAREVLGERRPVSPVRHLALSEALLNFSIERAPNIVADAGGELVYAGGDDVLALLPLERALDCAWKLSKAWGENFGPDGRLYPGERATASAGLVVFHAQDSLRAALTAARRAEERAKDHGRDRLGIVFRRRSGEHAEVTLRWPVVPALAELVTAFRDGAAGARWVYQLRAEIDGFGGVDDEAFLGEIRRLIRRSEERGGDAFADRMSDFFRDFARDASGSTTPTEQRDKWCQVVQGAEFMARGTEA